MVFFVYSGSALTESTYYFIVAMAALFGWFAFAKKRVVQNLLFSFLAAMAYLTKPEGIGFLLVFVVWVICINPPGLVKRRFRTRLWMAILALACFIIVSLPYLAQIRKDLGSWHILKKAYCIHRCFTTRGGGWGKGKRPTVSEETCRHLHSSENSFFTVSESILRIS